jgi:hypothetical protein
VELFSMGFTECLHSPVLPEPEGFLFSGSALVSHLNIAPRLSLARSSERPEMKKSVVIAALAAFVCSFTSSAATFADHVVSYNPGAGVSRHFTNDVSVVLGQPSTVNPFGDPTDPFDPPYGTNEILSVGAGGWLTVKFDTPVLNLPVNPFGRDFIIYGNSGFIITNDFDFTTFNWIGAPATDSSLFGENDGQTLVSVSRDGVHFYVLDPSRAPTVDVLFPTDGSANFQKPLDPSLTQADFAGLTMDQIRALYNGSAGGASYDISWAQDANGRPVYLPEVSYVRVDVLSGKSEIDGFAAVSGPRQGPKH